MRCDDDERLAANDDGEWYSLCAINNGAESAEQAEKTAVIEFPRQLIFENVGVQSGRLQLAEKTRSNHGHHFLNAFHPRTLRCRQ